MRVMQSRRGFAAPAVAAGAAALIGATPALADEGPPETTTIRLPYDPNICLSPAYIAAGTDWRFLNELKRELKT